MTQAEQNENADKVDSTDPAFGMNLSPREIVEELDRYIVGQDDAKRAIAIAVRNRWRRSRLSEDLQSEIAPKNILMAGPTGVGKTELARRLAKLTNAPFIKVEATKYTEVGYYGRDVESMVRDLVENAIGLIRGLEQERVKEQASEMAEERLLDLLTKSRNSYEDELATLDEDSDQAGRRKRTREKIRDMLRDGLMEDKQVEFSIEQRAMPMMMGGMENMGVDFQQMVDKMMPKSTKRRSMTVAQARKVLTEEEADKLIDEDKIASQAIEVSESKGIIFVDEID
ncbi:MAG: AAA family ATPase, partial [Planctomycetota bacterium]